MNKTANLHYQTLDNVDSILDFVLKPSSRGDTHGIGVGHPKLAAAKAWALKQQDPIDGEHLPNATQTTDELLAKGLSTDPFTKALINGANPEDGGGGGTPFWIEGNGDCSFNSVAALFVEAGARGSRSAVRTLAAKLRLSVVLKGIKYMELFLSEQYEFFGGWYNYESEVREGLAAGGWNIVPDTENGWRVGSYDCARLMYLAQLRHISHQGRWIQQFVFPILATVVQSPLRVFVPFNTINDAVGGPWKHTRFQPAFNARSSSPPIHMVMTLGCGEDYAPNFTGVNDFLRSTNGSLPELNHYVALSVNGAARAQARAEKKFKEAIVEARKVLGELSGEVTKALAQNRSGRQANKQLVAKEDTDGVSRLVDEQEKARSNVRRREADYKRLRGTYLVPLSSKTAAATAEKECFARRTEEAEQEARRKASAAAVEARARDEEKARGGESCRGKSETGKSGVEKDAPGTSSGPKDKTGKSGGRKHKDKTSGGVKDKTDESSGAKEKAGKPGEGKYKDRKSGWGKDKEGKSSGGKGKDGKSSGGRDQNHKLDGEKIKSDKPDGRKEKGIHCCGGGKDDMGKSDERMDQDGIGGGCTDKEGKSLAKWKKEQRRHNDNDTRMKDEAARKKKNLRKLRFRANRFRTKARNAEFEGCGDILPGSRLHNGSWNRTEIDFGTVMKVNVDVKHHQIVSYDVLMDSADSIITVQPDDVRQDVQYYREHHASSDPRDQRGSGVENVIRSKERRRFKGKGRSKEAGGGGPDEEISSDGEYVSGYGSRSRWGGGGGESREKNSSDEQKSSGEEYSSREESSSDGESNSDEETSPDEESNPGEGSSSGEESGRKNGSRPEDGSGGGSDGEKKSGGRSDLGKGNKLKTRSEGDSDREISSGGENGLRKWNRSRGGVVEGQIWRVVRIARGPGEGGGGGSDAESPSQKENGSDSDDERSSDGDSRSKKKKGPKRGARSEKLKKTKGGGRSGSGEEDNSTASSKERRRRQRKKNRHRRKDPRKGRDSKRKRSRRVYADVAGIARTGRAFDVFDSPSETWDAVFDTLIGELGALGHHTLQKKRRKMTVDKTRHSYCEIVCSHSGKKRNNSPKKEGVKPRTCSSKQVGCPFKIVITWPVRESTPSITSSDLRHSHDLRGAVSRAQEHVLPPSVVDDRIADIRRWTAGDLKARDIFKLLEMDNDGLLLCKAGKKKVYNAMQKVKEELYSTPEDAMNFLSSLESEPGMYVARTMDSQGRLVDVFWATVEQQQKMTRFGGCIQLDTTVFTNRYGCPLLFIVGVDDNNRSCILAQGLLRSECTETFEWFLQNYETAAGGRRPKVILTDADLAMTAAVASCWKSTLHMYCLWHVFKNVIKKCSSSLPDIDIRQLMLRLFRSAAYAATPEAFATYRAQLEELVAGTACESYMTDMIKNKTKWAFSCRPTVLTLGMVATQRTEGLFGVAKRSGVEKKLSLCALWGRLKRLNQMLEIETAKLATPAITAGLSFQNKHVDLFFEPIKQELGSVGASQYCQKEARSEVEGARSYDAELVAKGTFDENGQPLPLSASNLERIRLARPKLNILDEAPPDTDLEGEFYADRDSTDSSIWARTTLTAFLELIADVRIELVVAVRYKFTAKRPSHLVVFGPGNFHLCSCLQLLRRGLPCRHYFAVLLNLIGRTYITTELTFDHVFNGVCVHNRWRRSDDGSDEPWSVSEVLKSSGHGEGWDGHHEGDDENYWGPTLDDVSDGVHPAERAVQAGQDRKASDERRVFANMMAKSKDNVCDILRSVSLDKALHVQERLGEYVQFLLKSSGGDSGAKNPAKAPAKGRPRTKYSRGKPLQNQGGGDQKISENFRQPSNPEGRVDGSRRSKRHVDSNGNGSRKKSKRVN